MAGKRGKHKNNFSLRNKYEESWNYVKESRNFIYFVMGLFFVFALIGFFVPAPEIVSEEILKFLEELLEKTQGMSQLELILFILINNAQTSFFGMLFGVIFGIIPLISMIGNGYVLGFVSSIAVGEHSISVLLRLLPHGIFELPAIFISLGLGIKFGTFIFQKNKIESFREYFWNSLKVFIYIVIPLLIIAAIIEGSLIALF